MLTLASSTCFLPFLSFLPSFLPSFNIYSSNITPKILVLHCMLAFPLFHTSPLTTSISLAGCQTPALPYHILVRTLLHPVYPAFLPSLLLIILKTDIAVTLLEDTPCKSIVDTHTPNMLHIAGT